MSVMSNLNKRVNSIIVKQLPADFNADQLEELFGKFGQIVSKKVVPPNPGIDRSCGFVNYAEAESCDQAVKEMNGFVVKGLTLSVSHASSRTEIVDRLQNGSRMNAESNGRVTSSPRINSFRPASEQLIKPMPIKSFTEGDVNKPLWNGQSSISNLMGIKDHEVFVKNQTFSIYLSNLEVPNIVFAATLDDYISATLLITQMNKHEQLAKVQANSYKSKLAVGEVCAALFNTDWYRARVLEIGENRVRVQYIDWGNTGWCDSALEIRPLPNEYYKDPVLCVRCHVDGIPSNEKLSEEQKQAILGVLVLDVKLEMTVLRIENAIPYIRLNLGERNLNNEIRALLPSTAATIKSNQIIDFHSHQPDVNLSETHFVQLTTVDPQSECFHVLLMRDYLVTIMNVLKDWNVTKQPLTTPPKAKTLVCAQYDADDLWYRAWVENVTDKGYHVYFVDFGNEEIVSVDRLSECPERLRAIPWQSVQIKLANIKLTDNERHELLKDLETNRLEMKVIQKNQEVYVVDLINNGKSIVEQILEIRKKQPPVINETSKTPDIVEPIQQPVPKLTVAQPAASNDNISKPLPAVEPTNDNAINDSVTILITEQRRQSRLLEQVIAAINTSNALLNQLVQR